MLNWPPVPTWRVPAAAAEPGLVVLSLPPLSSRSVPPFTVVGPVKVFAKVDSSVPAPSLVNPLVRAVPIFVSGAASVNRPAAALVVSSVRIELVFMPTVGVLAPRWLASKIVARSLLSK